MTEFNIEAYLDSLPEDTTEINISYKNLTYIPNSILRFNFSDETFYMDMPVLKIYDY